MPSFHVKSAICSYIASEFEETGFEMYPYTFLALTFHGMKQKQLGKFLQKLPTLVFE
jgi:hypothetical protein